MALATCLVFIHIELLRGHYDPAIAHLRAGLKILDENKSRNGTASFGQDGDDQSADSVMAMAFSRLDLQAAHFGMGIPATHYAISDAERGVQQLSNNGFESLAQAKARCDTLMGSTFHFLARCRPPGSPRALEMPEVVYEWRRVLALHSNYMNALDNFLKRPDKVRNKKDCQGIILLRMHILTTYTLVAVCLAENEEEAFDQQIAEFKRIVSLADEFLSSFGDTNSQELRLPSLSTDWGIIPPLTVTAMKCRDPYIRRKALSILASWPHREGFWDSSLAMKFGLQIVELEEKPIQVGGIEGSPHAARMANVSLELGEDQHYGIMKWQRLEPGLAKGRVKESCLMHL